MMFRLAQLTELRHELSRARAIAEQLNLIHLANTLTHNLGVIQNEIHTLEKLRAQNTAQNPPKPRRTAKALASNTEYTTEEKQ